MKLQQSPKLNKKKNTIEFRISLPSADHIALAGSFNKWSPKDLAMKPQKNGTWKIEIPMLPSGKYHYKFCVDDSMWIEDIANQLREPDGISGWNSVLTV